MLLIPPWVKGGACAPGGAGGPGSGSGSPRHHQEEPVSATTAIYGSTPRPRLSSPTSCSSCCCATGRRGHLRRRVLRPSLRRPVTPALRFLQPAQPFPRAGAGAQVRPRRAARRARGLPGGDWTGSGASGLGWDRTWAGRTLEARFPACGF